MIYPFRLRVVLLCFIVSALLVLIGWRPTFALPEPPPPPPGPPPACVSETGPNKDVLKFLFDRFHETVERRGLLTDGRVDGWLVEITSDPEDGSWSVVMTNPDQISCIIAWGEFWEGADAPKQGDPL